MRLLKYLELTVKTKIAYMYHLGHPIDILKNICYKCWYFQDVILPYDWQRKVPFATCHSNVWFQEVRPLNNFYSERVYSIWTLQSSLYPLIVLHAPNGNWILLNCSKNNSKPISVNIKVANVKSNFKNDEVSRKTSFIFMNFDPIK